MRLPPLRTVLGLILATTVAVAGEAPAGIALAQRGAVVSGAVQVQPKGLSVGGTVLAWSDIAAATLPGAIAPSIDSGIVTLDGEVLRGVPRQIDKGELVFAGDLHGERKVPLAALAAVLLTPTSQGDLVRLLASEPGAVLANGERVAGNLAFCNPEAVGIDTGRRVAQVPRARVSAVVLRQPKPAQASRERVWCALATGDRLLVETVAGAATGLQLQGPSGTVAVDPRALVQVWCDGGRVTRLSAVPPVRASALDRIGAALPVAIGAGFPAMLAALPSTDGVLLSARGEIAWKTPGTGTLLLWVGCPADAVEASAAIALDGTVAWEQTLRPGAPPVPLSIPLKGAVEVALRTAPGPGGETARCVVAWCHPILVK